MRNAQGYACIMDPESGTQERDTFTCNHCQRITHVKARCSPTDAGGLCYVCNGLICKNCVGKECVPFMKQVEAMEERDYRRRTYGA